MDLGMIGDGLDHEIRSVADVGVRAEEDRANADGEDVLVEGGMAEQERDFDFFRPHRARGQMAGVVFLEGEERLLHGVGLLGQVRSAILHEMLHGLDGVRLDERAEDGFEETQVGGGVIENAGKHARTPVEEAGRGLVQTARVQLEPVQRWHHGGEDANK